MNQIAKIQNIVVNIISSPLYDSEYSLSIYNYDYSSKFIKCNKKSDFWTKLLLPLNMQHKRGTKHSFFRLKQTNDPSNPKSDYWGHLL
jgi:hypothetical protein